jgi:competence protein ComEC
MNAVHTRFRAYQLGSAGSSFSYFAGGHLTVLEGRLTEVSKPNLIQEMDLCNVETADTLHITSWDADHCSPSELDDLLDLTRPRTIECPGYEPHTDSARTSSKTIAAYKAKQERTNRSVTVRRITPDYISSLGHAEALAFRNVLYNPRSIDHDCPNNNSTVKFFRRGSVNVLSLGDVESPSISAGLRRCRHLRRETDVMILAHHGADNGFTTKRFLSRVDPELAICSSDYDNQYDHPCQSIRDLLYEHGVRLFTTKTGDVVVTSTGRHDGRFRVINLKTGSTEISSSYDYRSKKSVLLSHNADTIRQLYSPTPFRGR